MLPVLSRLRPLWLILPAACLGGCGVHPGAEFTDPGVIQISFNVSGRLHLPSHPPPYPLIIDLHGCDGIMPARDGLWYPEFNGAGVAVLQLDSFTGRGVAGICNNLFRVPPLVRSMDVAHAIRWVLNDARFDPQGIFLAGMSHGGTSSLLAQLHTDPIFSRLQGVIAFYPYCFDTIPTLNSDLLVLIGEEDDWTPAWRCRGMEILDHAGHSYELVVYPDAYHSYDVPNLNTIYLGHRVKYNEAAAKDSIERVIGFIKERVYSSRNRQ